MKNLDVELLELEGQVPYHIIIMHDWSIEIYGVYISGHDVSPNQIDH